MSEWQPIETAPKDGEPIIVAMRDTGFVTMACWDSHEKEWRELNNDWSDHWGFPLFPTDWQPKPEPPK